MLQRNSKPQAICDTKSASPSDIQKPASNVDLLSLLPKELWSGPIFDHNGPETNWALARPSATPSFFTANKQAQAHQDHVAFKQFCELICSGARTKAAELLSTKSYLALEQGKLIDAMGHRIRRIFKNISPLQYCYWAGDIHGLRTILQALKTDAEKAEAYRQMDEVDTYGVDYEQYPLTADEQIKIVRNEKRFNFQPLIDSDNTYIASTTEDNWIKLSHEQFQLPAHVLQEYCRGDRAFYPLTVNHFKEANLPEGFAVYDYGQSKYVSCFDSEAVSSYFDRAIFRAGLGVRPYEFWRVAFDPELRALCRDRAILDLSAMLRLIEVRIPALLDIKNELQPKLTLGASNK